jgi:ribosome-associated translation inhibitor RaiA
MTLPLDLLFLGMLPSPALSAVARDKVAHLEHVCRDLITCRVTIESEAARRDGPHFAVRIDVTWPGHEMAVDRMESPDANVALHDAFDAITRRVEEAQRRARVLAQAVHGET